MQQWITNFLEKNAALPATKTTEWRHFFVSWQDALLDNATGNRANAKIKFAKLLNWANKIPNLVVSSKDIYSTIYDQLGCWAAEENDLKMAKFYLEKTNYIQEPHSFVELKSNILKLENDLKKAVSVLSKGIKKRPVTEVYYVKLAEIYIEKRRFKQAVNVMIKCVAHSPQYKIHILRLIDYLKLSRMADKHNLIIHYEKVAADIDKNVAELENLFYL